MLRAYRHLECRSRPGQYWDPCNLPGGVGGSRAGHQRYRSSLCVQTPFMTAIRQPVNWALATRRFRRYSTGDRPDNCGSSKLLPPMLLHGTFWRVGSAVWLPWSGDSKIGHELLKAPFDFRWFERFRRPHERVNLVEIECCAG